MKRGRKNVLIIDHFDSFTHNLAQCLSSAGANVSVVRTNEPLPRSEFTHVVLSPGPGHPDEVPRFVEALERWAGRRPMLGVCLGCQAIGRWVGIPVVRARQLMHGKTSLVYRSGTNDGVLVGMPDPFEAMRYHSLVLDKAASQASSALTVTAWSDDGEVMAVRCGASSVFGVQFHPESYFTKDGERLLTNFLSLE